MMCELLYRRSAARALRRIPKRVAERIIAQLERLSVDPYAPDNMIAALKGRPGFRLRVGDWRVIYLVDDDAREIIVLEVSSRGSVYR